MTDYVFSDLGETAEERPTIDHDRIAAAVREILFAVGENPDREGLQETPARVARAYEEIFAGLHRDPAEILSVTFDISHEEMVLVRDIDLYSMCEHHLVPFHGVAHVGYIPAKNGKVTGLSKLARLVEVYARRPQVQERLTSQIADALMKHLEPQGRDRRRRSRAPVHDDARRAQTRCLDDHLGGARPAARTGLPGGGDEPHPPRLSDGDADHGRPQRHARLLLRRRPLVRPVLGRRPRARPPLLRSRHPRHRRRVDEAGSHPRR